MASALAPEIPSGASRGIRARPERDPERASGPGRFGPLRVTSALRGVCARPGRGLKPVGGCSPGKLRAYLWAFKSETRARCFFRIMDLSFSCW